MKTPYFIAYPAKIAENYRSMCSVLPVDRLYYATKANGEAPTLSALLTENAGFEIVCADEMESLISLGVRAEDIICSRPLKTAEEISRMYALGCRYFVYDCEKKIADFQAVLDKFAGCVKGINGLGSTLSEGSLTIVVGVAAAVVFGLGGFFAGKAAGKKKKPVLADGAEKEEKE